MIPVVTFTGPHNSGKTTIIRQVAGVLRGKGYRVGVIKSTKHRDIIKEPQHKDTALYRSDGVEQVVLFEANRAVCFLEHNPPLEQVAFNMLGYCDLVICEGFKRSPLPKIEVIGDNTQRLCLEDTHNLLAVVSREPVEGVRCFTPEQVESIAEFIEDMFLKKDWIRVMVDGKEIPMKPFVARTVASTITALIGNLKGAEKGERIEIVINTKEKGPQNPSST